MPDDLLEAMRLLMLVIGGAILGMAIYVVVIYSRRLASGDRRVLPQHIARLALSYSLLIGITAGTQYELMAGDEPLSWRLPLILIAYTVGIDGLRQILLDVRNRSRFLVKNPERRQHYKRDRIYQRDEER